MIFNSGFILFFQKTRKDYGYEGVVIYFLDINLNVIGILKKKTTW